jgi:hypothetical protein
MLVIADTSPLHYLVLIEQTDIPDSIELRGNALSPSRFY